MTPPTLDNLDEESSYPSPHTFRSRFEGYNNLLFRAGLQPNLEEYGDEEILELLREEYRERGFVKPSHDYLAQKEDAPNPRLIQARYGGLDEALEEAEIPVLEEDCKSTYFALAEEFSHQEPVQIPRSTVLRSD